MHHRRPEDGQKDVKLHRSLNAAGGCSPLIGRSDHQPCQTAVTSPQHRTGGDESCNEPPLPGGSRTWCGGPTLSGWLHRPEGPANTLSVSSSEPSAQATSASPTPTLSITSARRSSASPRCCGIDRSVIPELRAAAVSGTQSRKLQLVLSVACAAWVPALRCAQFRDDKRLREAAHEDRCRRADPVRLGRHPADQVYAGLAEHLGPQQPRPAAHQHRRRHRGPRLPRLRHQSGRDRCRRADQVPQADPDGQGPAAPARTCTPPCAPASASRGCA